MKAPPHIDPPSSPSANAPSPASLLGLVLGLVTSLGAVLPGTASALEFECSVPGDTRFLRMDLPGEDHLCEVSVTDAAGGRRVMWYADHETLFCSAKTYELRDRYVQTWKFDCREWPDQDGVDRLSARHRAILDLQLGALLAPDADGGPGAEVLGVRAAASTLLERSDGFLALQFMLAGDTDRVDIVLDEESGWRTVTEFDDLASRVTPLAGLSVTDAFVDAIGESGALDVTTLLARDGAGDTGGAAVCEGRQTLQVDTASGDVVPVGPHRYVCDEADGGTG